MDASIPANRKIRVHPDVVWRDVDGEVVLLNVVTGQYFGLDDVGSAVWAFLVQDGQDGQAGATLAELTERVLAAFDVDAPTATADLAALGTQLVDQQLVIITG